MQVILKKGLADETMKLNDRYQWIKNEKGIRLMNNALVEKIITECERLWPKTYSYSIDDASRDKAKGTKKGIINRKLKLEDYKNVYKIMKFILWL